MKYEEVYLKAYSNGREAKAGLDDYFRFYNTQRPHQVSGYRTPAEVFSCGSDTSPEQATERGCRKGVYAVILNRNNTLSITAYNKQCGLTRYPPLVCFAITLTK